MPEDFSVPSEALTPIAVENQSKELEKKTKQKNTHFLDLGRVQEQM